MPEQKLVMGKYKRLKIVQEETVQAYQSKLPSAVKLANGKTKMVERGDWIILYDDGSQDSYTPDTFKKVFEPVNEVSNV